LCRSLKTSPQKNTYSLLTSLRRLKGLNPNKKNTRTGRTRMGGGNTRGIPNVFSNTKATTPSRKIRIKMRITCEQMSHRRKEEQRRLLLRRRIFSKTELDRVAWLLTDTQ
jgi:hypothetical protein